MNTPIAKVISAIGALSFGTILSSCLPGEIEPFVGRIAQAAPTTAPIRDYKFQPVVIDRPTPDQDAVREHVAIATPRPEPQDKTSATRGGNVIRGQASWYCKEGVSVCHYQYPPGSMVAAACGKLRNAMGSNWRGKTVGVQNRSGRHVNVKLVDWCGSTDKLIDLYWEPMRRLGGTGVLPVTVRW